VANAVEHAFDGKHGHIKIGLHRRPTGGYEVSVADSGRGLAPDWQENIGLRTSRRMIGNIVSDSAGPVPHSRAREA
jgi:two-component sensor histidine kinase